MQPFPDLDVDLVADSLQAVARTAQKTGLAVAVIVAREPGVVAWAHLAADLIGALDVETTMTASTIKVCFRPVPPVEYPRSDSAPARLVGLHRLINFSRKH